MGDFNFVMSPQDRWSATSGGWADNGDSRDALVLKKYILAPFGFAEWEQTHFTCEAKAARARLDRIYINQHVSVQLDTNCRSFVLEWCPDLSTHRPIGVSRSKGGIKDLSSQALQLWPFKHHDFASRVQVEFNHQLHLCSDPSSSLGKLLLLKEAIRTVHDHIVAEKLTVKSDCIEDHLGWAIMYARCLENQKFDKASYIASCFPKLDSCGKSHFQRTVALHSRALGDHLNAVRGLIVELSRDAINCDIRELSKQSKDGGAERSNAKDHILRKLKRLSPGEMSSINCIIDDDGSFHTSPREMASALCKHWQEVFSPTECDSQLLKDWMNTLFSSTGSDSWDTKLCNPESHEWTIKKRHISGRL